MIRLLKKGIIVLVLLVTLLSGLPIKASALEGIDQDKPVSLMIQFLDSMDSETGKAAPVVGAQFDLYYVATVNGYGRYTLAGDFADYPVRLEDLDASEWRTLTSTLLNYVSADKLNPIDTGKTNDAGKLYFPNTIEKLLPGLYLVDSKELIGTEYTYQAEPFMVCLPGVDAEIKEWQYHVGVIVKYSKEPFTPEDTISRWVIKKWKGDAEQIRPDEVKIELRKNGEVYDTVTLNDKNNWRYQWESLPRYDAEKQTIQWSVVEKTVKNYQATVSLEKDTFIVTNTYAPDDEGGDKVRRVALKNWSDKGYESRRPSNIKVNLLKNGKIYDTKIISSINNWKYTWEDLPAKDADGKKIEWTIREVDIPGYVANYKQVGDNYLITNSLVKPTLPQTGVLWWPVPILIAGGLIMIILGGVLKGRADDE